MLDDYLAGATLYATAPQEGQVLVYTGAWTPVAAAGARGLVISEDTWSVVTADAILTYRGAALIRSLHADGNGWHEAVAQGDGFTVASPAASALVDADALGSQTPRWVVPGTDAGQFRSFVNGVATDETGAARWVTALGVSNVDDGWRAEAAATRGRVYDVSDGSVLATDLNFPHSPRYHEGYLWFLNSGEGQVRRGGDVFATVHGFARGLAHHNGYVFVGVSQARPSVMANVAVDPLASPGIAVLDATGAQVWFEPLDVREIFDVQIGA